MEHYETLKNLLPENEHRLPIEEGEGPYAWADEGNGVFMIRRDDDFIYGGLYFPPGPFALNHKGRIYHRTPLDDRLVDIKLDARAPVGETYPITEGTGWRGMSMPVKSAFARWRIWSPNTAIWKSGKCV